MSLRKIRKSRLRVSIVKSCIFTVITSLAVFENTQSGAAVANETVIHPGGSFLLLDYSFISLIVINS